MNSVYKSKDVGYYKIVREDLIYFLPKNGSQKILEIGSGQGSTLVEIKNRGLATEVVGVDLFEFENSDQTNPAIDKFIVANLETDTLELPVEYFDIILAGDVFEHLVDPWKVVKDLSKFLKKDGLFIASVPNIREVTTMSKIFFLRDFRYDPQGGILDKTHLRFFCKKNIRDLLTNEELNPVSITSSFKAVKNSKRKWLNRFTLGLAKDMLTTQYVAIAKKL
jgi:SAM-dependent methyltransferase